MSGDLNAALAHAALAYVRIFERFIALPAAVLMISLTSWAYFYDDQPAVVLIFTLAGAVAAGMFAVGYLNTERPGGSQP